MELLSLQAMCIGLIGKSKKKFIYFLTWFTTLLIFRDGIHGAVRETGESLKDLKHVLQGIGRPFELVSVPNECPRGKKHTVPTTFNTEALNFLFGLVSSPCETSICQKNQICLSNGRGGSVCKCSEESKAAGCEDIYP